VNSTAVFDKQYLEGRYEKVSWRLPLSGLTTPITTPFAYESMRIYVDLRKFQRKSEK
jgi:hypothetical protein